MQEAFAVSWLGGRHHVFGHRLQPLSAAHLFMLAAMESPVMSGDGRVSLADIMMACKVCACPIVLRNGSYVPAPKRHDFPQLGLSVGEKWKLARASINPRKMGPVVGAWKTYCEDYLTVPEKMETPGNQPRNLSCPGVLATVTQGLKVFGEQRAWSMPYGLLRTQLEILHEANGGDIRFCPGAKEQSEIEEQIREAEKAGAELLAKWEAESKGSTTL